MDNRHMLRLLERLKDRMNDPRTPPKARHLFQSLYTDALHAQEEYQHRLQELEERLLRNPEFWGDEIGRWLDDWVDDPDPDDEADTPNT
jgi:hypothetical protein